ncbi:sugar phosphate isomerase/epimerase family protein, partial [Rubrivirga sp.]|uniref:sugar phosphate isomerase/epimerase family protein n=1 Tax=Rubrivirga sp. TaxID=1885344 RepID=UPI003C70FCCA
MTTAWTTDISTQDAARAVRQTLLWGLDGVALRTVGGARVPNVTEGPLQRRLEDAELPVVALDPGLFEGDASSRAGWLNDIAVLEDVAPFALRAGCDVVRVGAFSSGDVQDRAVALGAAGEKARQLGLRLAVRNEVGTGVATGSELAELLIQIADPNVAADWRPADALEGGEAPGAGLDALLTAKLIPSVVSVRDLSGGLEVEIGSGDVGWAEHLRALVAAGFSGPLVIDGLPDPPRVSGLASSTALVQMARV